jgi:hypothetical protein
MHWAKVAEATCVVSDGAQGSSDTTLVLVTDSGVNDSRMLGARIATS